MNNEVIWHWRNAFCSMDFTLFGMFTEFRLKYENALEPIDSTLLGMEDVAHATTSLFVLVLIIALQLLRESYTVLPEATVIEDRLVQLQNGTPSILVTLSGIVIAVKPVHMLNAAQPMDVTLLGMVTEVKLLHKLKALFPMEVTL